jgi:hypothetical protein
MFIEALFIIAKSWNQPRCPPISEEIKKNTTLYPYNEYYSAT